jgi:hypothetical protein
VRRFHAGNLCALGQINITSEEKEKRYGRSDDTGHSTSYERNKPRKDWMRAVAELSLNVSKAALEGFLTSARKTSGTIEDQASGIRERSISFAAETLANTYDFAQQVMRARDPQKFLQLQGEFLSRQTKILANQTKELGQIMMLGANATQRAATEQMRKSAA